MSHYGCRQREQGGAVVPWIFICDTANVFFNKYSFCENITTLTNELNSLLCWLTLRGGGD